MLQETKLEGQALLEISKSKWNKKAGKAVSARGTSGGLATLWSEDLFHLNNFQATQHWIFTELKHKANHKPVQLILEEEEDLGPIPFRFSPQWIEREGFSDTVKEAWAKPINGSTSYVWEQKLKATKQALKDWIKKPIHTPTEQRKEAVQSLQTLQTDMETKEITTEVLETETQAQRSAHQSFRKEEEYWRIKSRSLWLKAGDRNTAYFHRQYRVRLSRNYIAEIKTADGQVYKGNNQVKAAAEAHFQNLFSSEAQNNDEETADFLSNIPKLINPEENAILCRPITEKEIINVIWAMDADKAPGPDGFTIRFYKTCWHIIKEDLQKMIRGFMAKAKIGGGTNSSYLALIPKDTNPETFSRFRPISLCNASYKILAKLLANRIKPLLKRVISSSQGGFVEGRHILDNVIQVQETIHSSKQRKEKGMVIKLDMANAFDRVNQSFLSKVLLSFGFSSTFVQLIKACIDNPWIAPLVNGRPTNFFKAKRGIRQGCPLSPYLYILMADSLSRKLNAERGSGMLPGLKTTTGTEPSNHALFADDSLLLGGASTRIARAFDKVLRRYCRVTGAAVNNNKSEVFSWNINQQELAGITSILGFKGSTEWDRFTYLGLPIISGINKRALWNGIISKMKKKIAAWGGHWLTKGGKVILIKSVLSAYPIFQAAFLLAPRKVMEQISKLLREFLWQGGKGNERRFHLVNWDVVKRTKEEGGLQIRDPHLVNLALGGKILWKLIHDPTHSVSNILRAKYGISKDLSNLTLPSTTKSTQLWNLCCKRSQHFKNHLYRIPGSSKHINVWTDSIMMNSPLADKTDITEIRSWLERAGVKRLYDLAKWNKHGEWEGWDLYGVPIRLETQLSLLEEYLEDATPVHRDAKDSWGWGQAGVYSTTEGYRVLQGKKNSNHPSSLWKSVWDSFATPKVNFFCWTLIHNKILTGDNLEKRKIAGPHRCAMCKNNSETALHLFMECRVAQEVWGHVLMDLQTPVPSFNSATDLFTSWKQHYPQKIPQKSLWNRIWSAIPKYICWQIWLARNHQIFNEVRHSSLQIAAKAKAFLIETAQHQYLKEDSLLLPQEKRWLGSLEPYPSRNCPKPQCNNQEWRLRDKEDYFQNWWRSQKIHTAFFDGASKGNPGTAGAGGVIYSPDGNTKDIFYWGLG
eukprot:PITA_04415